MLDFYNKLIYDLERIGGTMREFIVAGSAVSGVMLGLIAVVDLTPGGQIATGYVLSAVICLVVFLSAVSWPKRPWYSDAHKVSHHRHR